MIAFETVLIMLAVAVALLAAGRKWRLPYPVLLAVAGTGVALAPVDVGLQLDPELALALFVAPALLDAAYDTSLRDLKRNWLAVTSLALIAVGLTTATVAWVVHVMVPTIPWAAAIAIGAIVAPPDAVAATTVMRDIKLPHRIAVILNGEALLNDASTLLIYRLALTAIATGGTVGASAIAPAFLLSLVGSVVAGPILAWLVSWLIVRVTDAPSSIILQFVSTFGVWVVADRLGLSPILTIVVYAMTLARSSPARIPARLRIPSNAVWATAVVVLNVLAFLLIGLELGPVLAAARPGELSRWCGVGAAVVATVIVVRLSWALAAALLNRWWTLRQASRPADGPVSDWRTGLVVGWSGTRGIVTIATALALPPGFPERGMLLFAAFSVTLGTLLIQGSTLRWLVLVLKLKSDDQVERETNEARVATAAAALAALGDATGHDVDIVRAELVAQQRLASAFEGDGRPTELGTGPRVEALAARRRRLLEMRSDETIGEEAFHALQDELDIADLAVGKAFVERASRSPHDL